jgi:hypothetical protein
MKFSFELDSFLFPNDIRTIAIKTIEITVVIANEIRMLEMHNQNRHLCLKKPSK